MQDEKSIIESLRIQSFQNQIQIVYSLDYLANYIQIIMVNWASMLVRKERKNLNNYVHYFHEHKFQDNQNK
jgi:hypothetical protein